MIHTARAHALPSSPHPIARPSLAWARATCARGHRAFNLGVIAGIPIQFYLAGAVMFGAASFGPHRAGGFLLLLFGLLSFALAAAAGRALAEPALASAVLVLLLLQPVLATALRQPAPALAALHAVNGLAILAVALLIERRHRSRAGDTSTRVP